MTIYSNRDFTGQTLIEEDISGQIITSSCFAQEIPDTTVFPNSMTGVTFINCNLDNCFIPNGNTISGGSHRRIMVQPNGTDWIVDANNNPIEAL